MGTTEENSFVIDESDFLNTDIDKGNFSKSIDRILLEQNSIKKMIW